MTDRSVVARDCRQLDWGKFATNFTHSSRCNLATRLHTQPASEAAAGETNSVANQHGALESERHRQHVNRHMQSQAAPRVVGYLNPTRRAIRLKSKYEHP